ncbi:MAG: T9SS type A sorting domain-containing protein [Endomicrobiales bacterium]|jgi:hypothetical protein
MKRLIFIVATLMSVGVWCHADVIAYPNPWIPADPNPARGTLAGGITFSGLPSGSGGDIYVYTVSGNQVIHISFNNSGGTEKWTGKNSDGVYVASGVYLWVVKTDQLTKTGKIVIVR